MKAKKPIQRSAQILKDIHKVVTIQMRGRNPKEVSHLLRNVLVLVKQKTDKKEFILPILKL